MIMRAIFFSAVATIFFTLGACSPSAPGFEHIDGGPSPSTPQWSLDLVFSSDQPDEFNSFGKQVAILGDMVLVAEGKQTGPTEWGDKVHMWMRDGSGNWIFAGHIPHTEGLEWSGPVQDLELAQGWLALSMLAGDPESPSGLVRIFRLSGEDVEHVQDLFPGPQMNPITFGETISLSGELLLISSKLKADEGPSPGAVSVYEPSNDQWKPAGTINASTSNLESDFGASLAQYGETVVIGAPKEDSDVEETGAVYLYERTGTEQWEVSSKVVHPFQQFSRWFGFAVALDDGQLIVSSLGDSINSENGGSVFVLSKSSGQWEVDETLFSPAQESQFFGRHIDVEGDVMATSGYGEGMSGEVMLVDSSSDAREEVYLFADSNQNSGNFGESISLSGDCLLVGFPGGNVDSMEAGTANLYCRHL